MMLSQIRRAPRPALVPLPNLGLGALCRQHRELALAHLLPLLLVLVLLCAALWGIGQHAVQQSERRLAETERHVEEFRSGPVADAWRRLSAAWEAEGHRRDALLARVTSLSGAPREEALRAYQQFVLETVEQHRLQPAIATVAAFVERLGLCVRLGSCDPGIVAARLGGPLHWFHAQHRAYFAFDLPDEDLGSHLADIGLGDGRELSNGR